MDFSFHSPLIHNRLILECFHWGRNDFDNRFLIGDGSFFDLLKFISNFVKFNQFSLTLIFIQEMLY